MGVLAGSFILAWFLILLLFFLIFVAIARWVFRVNHIADKLDRIASLLDRLPLVEVRPDPAAPICPSCMKCDFYIDATNKTYCPNCKAYIKPCSR